MKKISWFIYFWCEEIVRITKMKAFWLDKIRGSKASADSRNGWNEKKKEKQIIRIVYYYVCYWFISKTHLLQSNWLRHNCCSRKIYIFSFYNLNKGKKIKKKKINVTIAVISIALRYCFMFKTKNCIKGEKTGTNMKLKSLNR